MSRLAVVLCVFCFALAIPRIAAAAADTSAPGHAIRISAQPLGTALQELAKQSGVQIIFFSAVIEGREAPAVHGTFTVEAALGILLAGTGMTFEPINDRTLQVLARTVAAVTGARPMQGSDPLSEVEIQAPREKLWRMRAELAGLEQRFFVEYNAINSNDDFDIHCNLSPGKRLKFGDSLRLCGPAFLKGAAWFAGGGGGSGSGVIGGSADAGLASIHGGLLSGSAVGPGYSGGAPLDQSSKWAAYEKHMLALINQSPQLRQIVNTRSALEERYRAIRRAQLKRSFIVH